MGERERAEYTVVVTGGAGFLGRVLVDQLLEADSLLPAREVRVYDLAGDDAPGVRPDPRLVRIRGDVRDLDRLREACRGADVVIHCAALVDWGRHPEEVLAAVNVVGTRTVIRACREARVPALVHTSTLDVVYSGTNAVGVDETAPVPEGPRDGYMRTKTEAEQIAVAANGSALAGDGGTLRTAVVRPACIWGEADPHHVGSLLRLSRWFPMIRVGRGPGGNASWAYVGNVAHAHLVVARDLVAGEGKAAGQVFFATDPTPANMFDFFEPVMHAAGRRVMPKALGIPKPIMDVVAAGMMSTSRALAPWVRFTPMITKFAVDFVCLDFVVSGDKIARELGYTPRYSESEAMARTVAWARETARS